MKTATVGLRNVAKRFGAVCANEDISFTVKAGTVHGLIGENGAGKSTSMKILFGLLRPDSGEILINEKPVRSWNVRKAAAHGIGMVQQHFHLSHVETAHDNIVLGKEMSVFGFRNRKAEKEKIQSIMSETGLSVPLDKRVGELPIGQQSRCEILKALYSGATTLILDEPTSVLTPNEVREFLNTLKNLKAKGYAILIVTHKLGEIIDVCDEVTVLRAGRTVAHLETTKTTAAQLAELMVGRSLMLPTTPSHEPNPAEVLKIDGPFSLVVHKKEVVGIAGVEGNGQDELIQLITRQQRSFAGRVVQYSLFGKDASHLDTREFRSQNVAAIPPDRHKEGLILDFTATENLLLGRRQTNSRDLEVLPSYVEQEVANQMKTFDVRPVQPLQKARGFSGGNQQKIIFARELSSLVDFILAAHPTRGVDLGAIEFIQRTLLDRAKEGAGVLLISSELSELLSLCHRIFVLYKKQLIGPFLRDIKTGCFDTEAIGRAMMGVSTESVIQ